MSEELKYKLYSPTECIPEQTMFDYIDNKLSAKERHLVEKHLLDCEFCSDAMEGLELVKNRGRITEINKAIEQRILLPGEKKETKIISFNYRMITAVAAAAALLIGAVFFFNTFTKKENDVAELKTTEAPPPPPPAKAAERVTTDSENYKTDKGVTTKDKEAQLEEKENQQQPVSVLAQPKPDNTREQTGLMNADKDADKKTAAGAGDVVTQADDQSKIVSEESNIPQAGVAAHEKVLKLDEAKKGEVDAANKNVSQNINGVFAWNTVPPENQKDEKVAGNEADQLAKKPGKDANDRFRSEGKEKRKDKSQATAETTPVLKDNRGASVAASAPQSTTGAEDAKTEITASVTTALADSVYTIASEMPSFPGGNDSLMKFIHKNFKPLAAAQEQTIINTKIIVRFTVGKNGVIKNPKIIKGINSEYDKEALRIVGIMPKWKPGKQNGKPVPVLYDLPIQLEMAK